ncbi:hypothetical protein KEM54_004167 [Ascosphaera aggregata]|nr:hypothetical protein KEM54_004167 [Ascosphaera aggregata]
MALDRAAVHLTKVISSDSDSSARSNGLNSSATAARIRRLSTYPSHIPVPVRPTQAKCRPGMVPENGSGYTMFKHSKTAPSAINTSKDTSERAAARINYKVSDQSLRNRARIVVNRKCVPTKDFNASGSERLPKNPIQKRSSLNLRCFSDTGPRIKDNLGFYSCQGQVSTLAQDPAGRLKSCTPGVHSGRPGQVHAEGSQQQNILKLSYGRGSNSSGNQATPITSRGCTDIGPRPWQHTTRIEAAKAKASAAETSITEEEENQGLVSTFPVSPL